MKKKDLLGEAAATALTVVMLAAVPVGLLAYHRHVVATEAHGRRVVNLYASAKAGFWLEDPVEGWNYFLAHPKPRPIRVRAGEPVLLRITSVDVHHGFSIPQLHIMTRDVTPGRWTEVEVQADDPGTYTMLCYTVCGNRHVYMEGELDVAQK
jgi:heme/copper-type cytochrome/quinol oxidase subunit 2